LEKFKTYLKALKYKTQAMAIDEPLYHYFTMVALHIRIIKVWSFFKSPSTNQPNIFTLHVTTRQYWLGIAKPQNVFRSTLNFELSSYEFLKISNLTNFSTD